MAINNKDNGGALVRWSGSCPGVGIVLSYPSAVRAREGYSEIGLSLIEVMMVRIDGVLVHKSPEIITMISETPIQLEGESE